MKAKISFVSGVLLGMLAGSRIGPGLYARVVSAAKSLAADPRVRRGASAAGDRAAHVAKSAGSSAAHQVKHAGSAVAQRFGDRFGDHRANGHQADGQPSSPSASARNGVAHGDRRFGDDPLSE
jgi:hypothetical protein